MIKVIDYGMGNSASVLNMIRKVNDAAELCSKPEQLNGAKAIILPGVGSFDNGMAKLENLKFIDALHNKVFLDKIPFLGVCLGMHLLFEKSEEGSLPGLGWIKGSVKKFDFSKLKLSSDLKVPNMGWRIIKPNSNKNLFFNLENEARFYFVHSYYANCVDQSDILATSIYGHQFTCSISRDNIWGVQFHPEKSHRFGMIFFENFLRVIKC
jgi:glutamine amidotransferase